MFLYIMMVEVLRIKLEHERESETIQGIIFMRGVKDINHSQFVVETLFLGATTNIVSMKLKLVLDNFLNAFEEKVNNLKI
jgi:hypothetical protein